MDAPYTCQFLAGVEALLFPDVQEPLKNYRAQAVQCSDR